MTKECSACGSSHIWKSRTTLHGYFCRPCWQRWQADSSNNKTHVPVVKKPIKKVSDKQAKLNTAYKVLRDKFIAYHPDCAAQLPGCTLKATEVHHSKGRVGGNMLDESTFVSLCQGCHAYLEVNVAEAKELGFSHSRLSK